MIFIDILYGYYLFLIHMNKWDGMPEDKQHRAGREAMARGTQGGAKVGAKGSLVISL